MDFFVTEIRFRKHVTKMAIKTLNPKLGRNHSKKWNFFELNNKKYFNKKSSSYMLFSRIQKIFEKNFKSKYFLFNEIISVNISYFNFFQKSQNYGHLPPYRDTFNDFFFN